MSADENASPADQCAAVAVVFGLVSLLTCWWFPYGPVVGVVGMGFGVIAWWAGVGGRALVGTALAACGAGAGLLLAGDYWWRVFGL
jgi:hypothetical protein